VLLAALAWAAVILWARSSAMMDAMPGRVTISGAGLFAGMWLLMMAAMMLPAITPIVLMFRTIQRQRRTRGSPVVPTAAFVTGYLVVWLLAGIAADLLYMAAKVAGDRLHTGSGAVPYIGGGIIVLAGLYQFSPLKHVCLAHCRSPFHIILHGWREGRVGAMRMGASHGLYCLGCCWGIMAVLLVVGLMNLAWMAALSILIALEKLAPRGVGIGRLVGVVFIILGITMAAQPRWFPAAGLEGNGDTSMADMAPAAPSPGPGRYTAISGPYALTLTVTPSEGGGMDGGRQQVVVQVTDRATGMAVTDAHPTLRLIGMGAPTAPLTLRPLPAAMGGMADGRFGATLQLMPGTYTSTVSVNGIVATLHLRLS
jgi:predicted metal-binding membrane protein